MHTGLIIRGCTWHWSGNKQWIDFPARSGSPIIEFVSGYSKHQELFQKQALAAVHDAVARAAVRDAVARVREEDAW
jgi:hypothetical protein